MRESGWVTTRESDGKVDFKNTLDGYRARRGVFRIVDIPSLQYLMIDGHGDPNSAEFARAVEALYPVAYKLKFASKSDLGRDYVVMPLEGLWWSDDMESFTTASDASRWDWTLLMMVPDWITSDLFRTVVEGIPPASAPSRVRDVRLETLDEGRCVQTLHVGPFDEEGPALERMHREFIPGEGLTMTGRHHEIYLSDLRKVPPEKLRTILRQPVRRGVETRR